MGECHGVVRLELKVSSNTDPLDLFFESLEKNSNNLVRNLMGKSGFL